MCKVFLGGTCNETTWRDELIKMIQVDYFNPVVDDWTPECIEIENIEKERKCNIHLYVITSAMTGVYSIAEVIDSAHKENVKTILQVIPNGFTHGQLKSLQAVVDLVKKHGSIAYIDEELARAARIINLHLPNPALNYKEK